MNAEKGKYYRGLSLDAFIAALDQKVQDAEQKPFSAFILIIENRQVLLKAHGHVKVADMLEKLCNKLALTLKNAELHRIADNQIIILMDGVNTNNNKKTQDKLKTLTHKFGTEIWGDETSHIYCLTAFIEINDLQDSSEILSQLYGAAVNPASLKLDISNSKQESRVLLELANEIYNALGNNRLRLAFQPIIEAKTGKTSHHECLLRIVDDKGNIGSAGSFIHIAEKMGIIEDIDLHVLNMVFAELEADETKHLAFNISNHTIFSEAWLNRFFEGATPSKARRLILEITETAVMHDLPKVAMFIAKVQETGCQVALDDFGSGYTSFRQIQTLSLDFVKIDGSLIKDIVNNQHNKILVASLIEFLKSLKLKTIAEFVDGGDTAKFLIESDIDYMQGNWFGAAE